VARKTRRKSQEEPSPRRRLRRSIRYDAVVEDPRERRGRMEAGMPPSINLRRLRAEQALAQLEAQLRAFSGMGRKKVLVVHGRGHGSTGGQPVLKGLVREWCHAHPGLVRGWSEAPREWGGEGAIVVLLN
jgi:DNA-nicking Smr family endonuclease